MPWKALRRTAMLIVILAAGTWAVLFGPLKGVLDSLTGQGP